MNDLDYILALAIVVIIHEFGHYFMARMMRVRVKRVQLFFISVFSFKPRASKKTHGTSWRDTVYSIGWLPFGGYTLFENHPAYLTLEDSYGRAYQIPYPKRVPKSVKEYYYDTKPAWKRFFISIAGVLFNILAALIMVIVVISITNIEGDSTFWEEVSAGFEFFMFTLSTMIHNLAGLLGIHTGQPYISPENYDLIQSFALTAKSYPILMNVATVSILLAFINILPIPPLDGGQATFETYEMITRKAPSPGFKRGASIVGSIIFIVVFWILPMLQR